MIDKVCENLFISGAGPLMSKDGHLEIEKLQISHVLTVSASAVPMEKRISGIDYHFLFVMDMDGQDLLGSGILDEGVDYITAAVRDGGKVLVHCEVGVSRSVTIVAGYCMKKFEWDPDRAIQFIKNQRPVAYPNSGFREQLAIFDRLGYKADSNSLAGCQEYRKWCVDNGNVPQSGSDPSAQAFVRDIGISEQKTEQDRGNKFRCAKCRQPLFFGEHIVKHQTQNGTECTLKHVIEPMQWMQLDEYQGKVNCPSCGEKLGHYSWGGRQCDGESGNRCGEQVIPWVHIHKSKADEVLPRIPLDQVQRMSLGTTSSNSPNIPSVVIS